MKLKTQKDAIAHAIEEFPKESCGIVVAVGRKEVYIRCKNTATTPSEHFHISNDDYDAAQEYGEIIAIVHSHPQKSPKPSEHDLVSCEISNVVWHILAVHTDPAHPELGPRVVGMHSFEPSGYEAPLVGRDFSFGINDCYGLVRDWYKRTLQIDLPNFAREDKFWERGENIIEENMEAAGFATAKGQIKIGDVVLMNIKSDIINHCAVYVGDGIILQHMYEHLSTRDPFGGYWQENTRRVVRREK